MSEETHVTVDIERQETSYIWVDRRHVRSDSSVFNEYYSSKIVQVNFQEMVRVNFEVMVHTQSLSASVVVGCS